MLDSLTFRELKEMVGTKPAERPYPKAKDLLTSDEEILFSAEKCGSFFTVFESGLFIYQNGLHKTVFDVHRCDRITYYLSDGIKPIAEDLYLDAPWYIPLMVIGEHRIEESMELHNSNHISFSLDHDKALRYQAIWDYELKRQIEEREAERNRRVLHAALETLTPRQRELIISYYLHEDDVTVTQEDLARKLGVTQQAIQITLDRALKNLKKYFDERL